MSSSADSASFPARPPGGGRFSSVRIPLAFVVVVGLLLAAVWWLPRETFDRGMRMSVLMFGSLITALLLLAWFVFLSAFARSTRTVGLLIAVAAAFVAVGAIRRVEFSGDMEPTFDFRWSPDRAVLLEAHRQAHHAEQAIAAADIAPGEFDVLEYRGSGSTGVMPGPALARDWSAQPPRLLWRQPVGGGYASFVLMGPLLITIEQRRDQEAIVAYDPATGAERWAHEYPALFHENMGGDGPRATPTIHNNRVYALGATGILNCLELATGRPLWTKDILKIAGSENLMWGMSGSPLVFDNCVVVNPGSQKATKPNDALLALNADTGTLLWSTGEAQASYCSPMLASIAGQRQVLLFDAVGLAGFDAAAGSLLWSTPWKSDYDTNAAQPILLADDRVLITSASGVALFQITLADGKSSVREVWKNRNLKCSYACPIERAGFVYGLDEGILACIDLANGKRRWKGGRYGHGQILLRDDLLIVQAESGELALVEANPEAFRELGRIPAIEGKTWNNPTLSGNRIFVRNHLEMAAYELPLADVQPANSSEPPATPEMPSEEQGKPADKQNADSKPAAE